MINRLLLVCIGWIFTQSVWALPATPEPGFTQNVQLQALFSTALQNNPSLALVRAQERVAYRNQQKMDSLAKPQVDFKSELSYAWMKKNDFARTASQISARYPLYQPDDTNLINIADNQHDAALYQEKAQEQQLLLKIAQQYFNYWALKVEFEFLEKEQNSITEILRQVNQRFQIGYQDLNDITEVQARLDTNRADLFKAQQRMQITQAELEELVGSTVDLSSFQPPKNLPPLIALKQSSAIESIWSKWVESNPELQAMMLEQSAATEQVEYEKNRDGIQVEAFSALVYNDSDGNFYDDMQGLKAGVQVNIPLYTGGKTDASVAKARAAKTAVGAKIKQKRLALEGQAKRAYISYNAQLTTLTALKAALSSNQQAKKATENGLSTGTRNILDLLTAQRNLHRAERDVPKTVSQIWTNWYLYYWSAGLLKHSEN